MTPSSDHTIPQLRAEFDRRVMVGALWRVPHWPIGDLVEFLASDSPHAKRLRPLTIGDLRARAVDFERRAHVERLSGIEFDRAVFGIVAEASDWVKCSYVLARAGGPRWKVQQSLGRLVAARRLERHGITSATQYRVWRRAS